jgi:hypothetical protein
MHNFWLLDMSHQYFAVTIPSRYGGFGASVAYSSSGDIPQYENFEKVGEYSAYDLIGTLGYANSLVGTLSLGMGLKFIQQKIEEEEASSYAADLGLMYEVDFVRGMTIGITVQNLGPDIQFLEQEDPLPFNVKGGLAYRAGPLLLASDVNSPKDNDISLNFGGEFLISNILAFRAGYNSANTYTAGLGLTLNLLSFEYAYVPFEDIEDTHRIAVGLEF